MFRPTGWHARLMDATWGVVIVAVVGVAGTLIGSVLQSRHARKLAREQRNHEVSDARNDALLSAYLSFVEAMDAIERVREAWVLTDIDETTKGRLADARFRLRLRESAMVVHAPAPVASAARALVDAYCAWEFYEPDPDQQAMKDRLANEIRCALGS